jgi:hypothetical protein
VAGVGNNLSILKNCGSSLTLLHDLTLLYTTLNLSPELIHRLVALKSLLDLGDMELVSVASSRLEKDRQEAEIAGILSALEDHRYAEAAGLIDKLLSDGTRHARWTDPEIALLEVELERVTAELADLETEQAELEHLVSRFQAAHNETLGERIARLLKLRMRMLERQLKTDPEKRAPYEQASRDFEEFQRDQEIQKEVDARTKWELSAEEQSELKRLFRKGSKLCHPDLVSAEHHDAAAEMFRQLSKAYDEGDLERVRQLVTRAAAGLFDASGETGDTDERRKERLKARIAGIRDSLERTLTHIHLIKRSATYQTMLENANWAELFEKQAKLLDQEIENLSVTLEEIQDDDT